MVILFLLIALITQTQIARGLRRTYTDDLDDESFEMMIAGSYRPTVSHYSKHLVSLRTTKPIEYWGDNHFCAGVVLNFKTILTAAHCVVELQNVIMKRTRIRIIAGTPKRLQQPLQGSFEIKEIIPHPDYKRYKVSDIAVLILKGRMTPNPGLLAPVEIESNKIPTNTKCLTVGWGQIFPGGPYANELLYLDVIIAKHSVCMSKLENYISEGNICAVDEHNEADVCPGDTGGPLICNSKLVGIIAGSKPCIGNAPIKFTSAIYFSKWINEVSSTKRTLEFQNLRNFLILMVLYLFVVKN